MVISGDYWWLIVITGDFIVINGDFMGFTGDYWWLIVITGD